jgi:hypothetical protein
VTILNLHVTSDRAFLVMDTRVAPGLNRSKFMTFGHLPAVVGVCGSSMILGTAASYISAVQGFDALVDHLATRMTDTFRAIRPDLEQHSTPAAGDTVEKQELVLAGWSAREGRMVAFSVVQGNEGGGCISRPIAGHYLVPRAGEKRYGRLPRSIDEMICVAQWQTEFINAVSPGSAGGKLILATVTRDAIYVQTVCNLDTAAPVMSPEHAAKILLPERRERSG